MSKEFDLSPLKKEDIENIVGEILLRVSDVDQDGRLWGLDTDCGDFEKIKKTAAEKINTRLRGALKGLKKRILKEYCGCHINEPCQLCREFKKSFGVLEEKR